MISLAVSIDQNVLWLQFSVRDVHVSIDMQRRHDFTSLDHQLEFLLKVQFLRLVKSLQISLVCILQDQNGELIKADPFNLNELFGVLGRYYFADFLDVLKELNKFHFVV